MVLDVTGEMRVASEYDVVVETLLKNYDTISHGMDP